MGSDPLSAQPVSAVGNITPVISPVKVKVFHPPPTGVLSSSPISPPPPPPPAGSALGPGQESVLDLEAPVDIQQPETFLDQPETSASQILPGVLLHLWKICTQIVHRTRNRNLMMTCRRIRLLDERLILRRKIGYILRTRVIVRL